MKFKIEREDLLKPLQAVIGVVERRQTMPILSNVLLLADGEKLKITATDLEVELVGETSLIPETPGQITVPGRKFFDICKNLPEKCMISCETDGEKLIVKAGKSRFMLSTLPAAEFPVVDEVVSVSRLKVDQADLKKCIESTQFAMANQDVRYYLNGMLFAVSEGVLTAVATDAHRLAAYRLPVDEMSGEVQVILPRKGVLELLRLLDEGDNRVELLIGSNHLSVQQGGVQLTSKLIDGRYPDYERVIPSGSDQIGLADRDTLRAALARAAILSNEKYRGVRLGFSEGLLKIQTNNPEQEMAEDEVELRYQGTPLEIGFNIGYVMDALSVLPPGDCTFGLTDSNSSCVIRSDGIEQATYVLMPMRL